MKHESPAAMMLAHYQDVIDTIQPPLYQDCAMFAMAFVVHIMLNAHEGDLHKVSEDIETLADHALKQLGSNIAGEKKMVRH